MPLDSVIGTIVDEKRDSIVQWIISKYVPVSKKKDTYLQSPQFHFLNKSWCLRLYTNGDSQSVGSLAVYLVCQNITDRHFSLTFWIGFRLCFKQKGIEPTSELYSFEKEIEPASELYTFNNDNQSHKKRNLYKASLLWNSSIPTDMQIDCIVQEEHPQPMDHESSFCTSQYSCDFMDLLTSGLKSDVIIEVGDYNLHAHMLILGARSTTLKNMFTENMRKNTRSILKVDDCDVFTVKSFLDFVYTGQLDSGASSERDSCLYKLAARFSVTDLKKQCTQLIEQKLSVATVYDVFELANTHNDSRLMESAERFLINNFDKILYTKPWKTFTIKHKSQSEEILSKIRQKFKC